MWYKFRQKIISDVNILNSLYTTLSGRFNLQKGNKRFDELIWSLVVRYLYRMRGCVIRELNE